MTGRKGDAPGMLDGPRCVLELGGEAFPPLLARCSPAPKRLFVVGNPQALLMPALAVVGARKATPYGRGCARRFAQMAAERGVCIVSGGARGCDAEAHRAALEANGATVAFLGGGCDRVYPPENFALFQQIVDAGGAVVSEREWDFPPVPYAFRARNRLIAGLAAATLIVEAGLPSGTFSTADEALSVGAEVLAVPGAITSASSRGANRLIAQGAVPIVDDESFSDALFSLYGCLKQQVMPSEASPGAPCAESAADDALLAAISAEPLGMERLRVMASDLAPASDDAWTWLAVHLAELEARGSIVRYPDGRIGPVVPSPLV